MLIVEDKVLKAANESKKLWVHLFEKALASYMTDESNFYIFLTKRNLIKFLKYYLERWHSMQKESSYILRQLFNS